MTRAQNSAALVLAFAITIGTVPPSSATADAAEEAAVGLVLSKYITALQRLDASGARDLFAPDSEIIESGGVEGTFERYLEHHIGPELKELKSFAISEYRVGVAIEGHLALATETFRYRIELPTNQITERLAAVTSVLRRTEQGWKIERYHWSSRQSPTTSIKP